ncbi:MAG: hypothetical protein IMY73_04260 [Bacteroidetes bacterium]|nr:hypothetical protein [Bacteroidota bacterium]
MRTSNLKYGVMFIISFFLSVSLFAESKPDPIKKGVVKNKSFENNVCCTVVLAESCEFVYDFKIKKNNALKILESGCGKMVNNYSVGNFEYHDFTYGGQSVARLVVNEKENTLMLVMYRFKNLK